jgi:signal transduction histidine kinase
MTTGTPVPRAGLRYAPGAGIAASARGLAFFGLMLAGAALMLALAVPVAGLGVWFLLLGRGHQGPAASQRLILGLAVTLAWLGISLFLIPRILLAIRRLADLTRRLAGQWCGVPIAACYLPPPGVGDGAGGGSGAEISFWPRLEWLLTDPATLRDLVWMTLNPLLAWVLAAPAVLATYGLIGLIGPNVDRAIAIPPPAFPGNSTGVIVTLGVAFIAAGLWAAPWLLRAYGACARSLLAPAGQAELARRVHHLAQTRSETIDTGAAQVRRIERDLHDGAQARLVAMGMTLDAAGQIIDTNPAAARALLLEARDASAKALAELRDLVRGIHPPVLADRGLADAVHALALDSPLRTHLASNLPGRPPGAVESAAYFAISELLANVSKHAEAGQAWIDIRHSAGMLRIGVCDDGRGGADPAHGTGLRGLERRLAAFDGVLAVNSPPGGPTVVNMEIPCALSSPKTSSC